MSITPIHLVRRDDWAPRFNTYIVEAQKLPFVWGEHDCCTFVADAILRMTDTDPMSQFRGQYTTEQGADEVVKEIGAGNLYKTLIRILGKPVRGIYGRKGDVAFYEGCCGLVVGRAAIFRGAEGFVMVPISRLQRAFKIGE